MNYRLLIAIWRSRNSYSSFRSESEMRCFPTFVGFAISLHDTRTTRRTTKLADRFRSRSTRDSLCITGSMRSTAMSKSSDHGLPGCQPKGTQLRWPRSSGKNQNQEHPIASQIRFAHELVRTDGPGASPGAGRRCLFPEAHRPRRLDPRRLCPPSARRKPTGDQGGGVASLRACPSAELYRELCRKLYRTRPFR
jgi:hypothetical protein